MFHYPPINPLGFESSQPEDKRTVKCFTYEMMRGYCDGLLGKIPGTSMCCIEVGQENRSWLITLTACNDSYEPLVDPYSRHKIVFVADSVDDNFSRFLNGRRRDYYKPKSDKQPLQTKDSGYKDTLNLVLREVVQILKGTIPNRKSGVATFRFVPSMIDTYGTVPGSSIIIASMRVLCKYIPLSGVIDDNVFLVVEYDNRFGAIVKYDFVELDEQVRKVVEEYNGILAVN